MNTSKDLSESVIFPKGEKIKIPYFTGIAWLESLVPKDSTFNCPIGNVTFEPGARTNWHRHPGGQILLITGGKGYFQEEGKPAQVIQEGDVVKIYPGMKHWHGATPDNWLVHLSITPNAQKGDAEWLEPVTGEEYNNLKMH
jgi:quercetin dioxygenase-like cupin family protein